MLSSTKYLYVSSDGKKKEVYSPDYFPLDKIWLVNEVKIFTDNTDPNVIYPEGTFTKIAEGRTLIGSSTSYSLGSTGGSSTVTLTESQMPQHYHVVNSHTHTGPSHSHNVYTNGTSWSNNSAGTISAATWDGYSTGNIVGSRTDNGNCSIGTSGGTDMMRYNLQNPPHSHSCYCGTAGTGNTGSASPDTSSVGSGSAHNNMQPYLVVNYWKRTK